MSKTGEENKFKFTHNKLKGLSTTKKEGRLTKWDSKVDGLHVRVSYGGTKTFYLRYRLKGRQRRYKLGRFPDMSLRHARDVAREKLIQISNGIDPKKEEKRRNNDATFEELVQTYWTEYAEPKLAEKTKKQYRRIIDNHLLPSFRHEDPSEITPEQVKELMSSVADGAEKSPYSEQHKLKGNRMANCVRKVLNSIYGNTNTVEANSPGRNVQKLEEKRSRTNTLSEEQIKIFWQGVENQDPVIEYYMKMLLLTGQRKTETARMRWDDIDGDVWKIPPEETKNSELHLLPLSPLAQQILGELEQINGGKDWVFHSPHNRNDGPIHSFSNVVKRIRQDCGFDREDFRLHDLRRTLTTNMAKLEVPSETCKRILNHSIPGVTDRHYDEYEYLPQKRQALNKWSRLVADLVEINPNRSLEDESTLIKEEIESFRENLEEISLNKETKQEITAQLNTINSQLESSNPSDVIIEECKNQIRNALLEEFQEEKVQEILNYS